MHVRFLLIRVVPVVLLAVLPACNPSLASEPNRDWLAVGSQGMVASDSVYASEAGAKILREGGNAIDAAVATSFCLSVTRPYSMGLGGGGFMMIRLAKTGDVWVIDYRETAPAATTADMYVKARAKNPRGPSPSEYGGLAAGVPGLVAGHSAVLEKLGTRKLRDTLESAVNLSADGFKIDENYCGIVSDMMRKMRRKPALIELGGDLRKTFLFDGQIPKPGDTLRQPQLATALKLLQDQGADAFYRGDIAKALVKADRAAGGILTLDDFAHYKPVWRDPLRLTYRDRYEILLMPPPSSGGICIAETLNVLESWNMTAVRLRDQSLAAHLTIEAMKHAFADRANLLGDADFVDVPLMHLTSKAYAKELAAHIDENHVAKIESYGTPLKDAGTSHFSIVDRWGNVVACTETINTSFGSWVMAPEYGIVLNNEMDDFTAEPGKPNAFGLTQSARNAAAPGKRPLSSMSPTIVLRDRKPILTVGASGGPRIITATLEVMLDVIDYAQPLDVAIEQPRFHHQWQPDMVYRNQLPADSPMIAGLKRRGHTISDDKEDAVVQAIQIMPGHLIGASDPRKGGKPVGY